MFVNLQNDLKTCQGDFGAHVITGIRLLCKAETDHNFTADHFGAIVVSSYLTFVDNRRILDGGDGLKALEKPRMPAIIKVRNLSHLNKC